MTLDLSNPEDAFEYLKTFDRAGLLSFDDGEGLEELTDEEVLRIAQQVFLKSHDWARRMH